MGTLLESELIFVIVSHWISTLCNTVYGYWVIIMQLAIIYFMEAFCSAFLLKFIFNF